MAADLPPPFPLCWPPNRSRTLAAVRDRTKRYSVATFVSALDTIEAEVKRWRAGHRSRRVVSWELTSNHTGRKAGADDDPGAALWFTLAGADITAGQDLMVLACDRFTLVAQNVRAISLTMERLRLVDEIGAYTLVAAMQGARALPPPSGGPPAPHDWRVVLDVSMTAPLAVAEAAYRAKAKLAGEGSPKLTALNLAVEAARRELGAC